MSIFKLISTRSKWDNYSGREMEFANEKHFENWFNKATSNGLKIIGIFDLETEVRFETVPTDEQMLQIGRIENDGNLIDFFKNEKNYSFKYFRTSTQKRKTLTYWINAHEQHSFTWSNGILTKQTSKHHKNIPIYKSKEILKFMQS